MVLNNERKIERDRRNLIKEKDINLGKQCVGEYIIYNFYNLTRDNSTVKRMCKEHYKDNTLNECKKCSKKTLINKQLREVIDNDIYELLLRGYELITIE